MASSAAGVLRRAVRLLNGAGSRAAVAGQPIPATHPEASAVPLPQLLPLPLVLCYCAVVASRCSVPRGPPTRSCWLRASCCRAWPRPSLRHDEGRWQICCRRVAWRCCPQPPRSLWLVRGWVKSGPGVYGLHLS